MWILFKLIIAICGFFVRAVSRKFRPAYKNEFNGQPYYDHYQQSRFGSGHQQIGLPASEHIRDIYFKLTPEKPIDRFFKWIGFSQEFQTGFSDFDSRVYIASDHPFFWRALQNSPSLRQDILFIFDNNARAIRSTGTSIDFSIRSPRIERDSPVFHALLRIHKEIEAGLKNLPSKYSDTFGWKVLLVESVIFMLIFHAIGVFGELILDSGSTILHPQQLILPTAALSAILFAVLFICTRIFLGASSRAHRIFLEIGLVLMLTLPLSVANALKDINVQFDRPENMHSYLVTDYSTTKEVRRGRRGGTYYYLRTRIPELSGKSLKINISSSTYYGLQSQQPFFIKIGRGYLSYPWIEGYYQVKQ